MSKRIIRINRYNFHTHCDSNPLDTQLIYLNLRNIKYFPFQITTCFQRNSYTISRIECNYFTHTVVNDLKLKGTERQLNFQNYVHSLIKIV